MCAGLLTVGWILVLFKIVNKHESTNKKIAKLTIALLQLASVITSGVARYFYADITTTVGINYWY